MSAALPAPGGPDDATVAKGGEANALHPPPAQPAPTQQTGLPLVLQDIFFPPVLQKRVHEKYNTALLAEATPQQLQQAQGVISVMHDAVDGSIFDRMPRLKVVSNFGAGYDHVDVAEAEKRGILCGHTPGAVGDSTAELGIALMLAAARRVVEGNHRARKSLMDPWWFGKTLSGATLGIVGMGDIGSRVANKASAAFNMRVHYYSRSRKSEEVEAQAGGAKYFPDLLELCSSSDVIVATVALTPATIGLIGKKEFEVMKSDALFINIARGGVIDTSALVEALLENQIGCAVLDVTEPEPLPPGHPLFDIDESKLILTPHLGTANLATRGLMLKLALDNLDAGLSGHDLPHRAAVL